MHESKPLSVRGKARLARNRVLAMAATAAMTLGFLAVVIAPTPAHALDNAQALTPPMGWNSWNQVRCNDLTEAVVKNAADSIVDRGLQDHGYEYVVIDDCWQGGRDSNGVLFADPTRFPDGIAALADYVHARGLKLGIYSSPGSETCGNFYDQYPVTGIASLGHEQQDADTFASWGVDYLKYDWCRADVTDNLDRPTAFKKMRDDLANTNRPITYAISEYGVTQPWTWAAPVANLWRTTSDIAANWNSVLGIINSQDGLESYSGPGAWNDPDMLQIGNGSLTLTEDKTHFAMWSMLAAPLFLGTDISALPTDVINVVSNPEIISIDQDALGHQASKIADSNGLEVWARPLEGGDIAVALLNTTSSSAKISTSLDAVGATGSRYVVRDAWSHTDTTNTAGPVSATVASHDTAVLRLTPGTDDSLPNVVDVNGSAAISQGSRANVNVTVDNGGSAALSDGDLAITAPAESSGLTLQSATVAVPSVAAKSADSVKVGVNVADDAPLGVTTIPVTFTSGSDTVESSITVTVMPAVPVGDTRISALPFVSSSKDWGDIERDTSVTGTPLLVNGTASDYGIGSNAPSTVTVWLGGQCSALTGSLGIDDDTDGGSAQWGYPSIGGTITADGNQLWRTSSIIHYKESEAFSLDVTGVQSLTLSTDIGGDTNAYDHADWLGLGLSCAAADTVAPVTTASFASHPSATGWYTQAPVMTLNATDDSDVYVIEYRLSSDDPWHTYTDPVTLPDGAMTVQYRAIDSSGNTEEPGSSDLSIDTIAPTVKATVDRSTRTVTIAAADEGSGVDHIEYTRDGGASWIPYLKPIVVTNPDAVTLGYRATDKAGLDSGETSEVTVTAVVAGTEPVNDGTSSGSDGAAAVSVATVSGPAAELASTGSSLDGGLWRAIMLLLSGGVLLLLRRRRGKQA